MCVGRTSDRWTFAPRCESCETSSRDKVARRAPSVLGRDRTAAAAASSRESSSPPIWGVVRNESGG